MNEIELKFIGWDSWDRPVYEYDGNIYCDVSPLERCKPDICTKYNNEFNGEPDSPIKNDIKLKFIPKRYTWR